MIDQPFTTPGLKIPTRQPTPGELLFAFVRASDRRQCRVNCAITARTAGKRNSANAARCFMRAADS
jgi:hypothetical protein